MKKVYQTLVDKHKGNCMQAAIASLFELELYEVPNFIELNENNWFDIYQKFYVINKYNAPTPFNINSNKFDYKTKVKILEHDKGVNGFFYASVPGQTFKGTTHAVIIDTKLKIVHDPNINQLALKLKPEDILSVDVIREDWHIDISGNFKIEN